MADLIDRQAAIDAADRVDYTELAIEDVKKVTDEVVKEIKKLPPAQSEIDSLDAVRHARKVLWDKCKKYLAEHTDEACPILYGKYQEEYTCMTNEVKAMSKAIYIMEGMKNRGEISALPSTQPDLSAYSDRLWKAAYERGKAEAETRWISVEERLPEKSGRYIVTRGLNACGAMWNRVYIINYSDLMGLKSEKIWWDGNVGKSDFERIDDVIAWMPLPEPYERSKE